MLEHGSEFSVGNCDAGATYTSTNRLGAPYHHKRSTSGQRCGMLHGHIEINRRKANLNLVRNVQNLVLRVEVPRLARGNHDGFFCASRRAKNEAQARKARLSACRNNTWISATLKSRPSTKGTTLLSMCISPGPLAVCHLVHRPHCAPTPHEIVGVLVRVKDADLALVVAVTNTNNLAMAA